MFGWQVIIIYYLSKVNVKHSKASFSTSFYVFNTKHNMQFVKRVDEFTNQFTPFQELLPRVGEAMWAQI